MKKTFNYIPGHLLVGLITGIIIEYYTNISINILTLIFILFFIILVYSKYYKKIIVFTCFALIIAICLGVFSVKLNADCNYKNHYKYSAKRGSSLFIKVYEVLKPSKKYVKFKGSIIQVDTTITQGDIIINIKKDTLEKINIKIDDVYITKGLLQKIKEPLNPYEFSYKKYLEKQQISHQLFLDKRDFHYLKKGTLSLKGIASNIRRKIQSSLINNGFKKNEYAIINALLLGQRQEVSKDIIKNYINAGAIHILAISGLHIGIILLILNFILKPLLKLPKGMFLRTILILIILWSFALIAGMSASVVRAVTMFSFIAIGQTFLKKQPIEFSIITSLFILLLVHPMYLFDVGFQLSYLAVLGIVIIQPKIYELWNPKIKFVNYIWTLITVSVSAQISVLPLSLHYFNQFPLLFILSNLVIVPLLGLILIGGLLIIGLSLINILPNELVIVYSKIILWMNNFIGWIADKEDFLITKISISLITTLLFYILLISLSYFIYSKKTKALIVSLCIIILLQIVLITDKYDRQNKHEFIIFHNNKKELLAVRNGDSITIFSNEEKTELVKKNPIKAYINEEKVIIDTVKTLPKIIKINEKKVMFIDSLGVYTKEIKNPLHVVLQNSPKINLNRLIDSLKPKIIIADGSNYKSYVMNWRLTCKHKKTPFHYTGENGAYILNSK